MQDHTFVGVPVRKMSDADLDHVLTEGFVVINDDGRADAAYWIRLRLEVEVEIRRLERNTV
jgi:hypothetical protein